MGTYNIVAGCIVALIVIGALIFAFVRSLFPNARQEQEDQDAYAEALGDASLLDRDGGSY